MVKKTDSKLYVVRSYVMAECARDALNKAKKTEPEDVCVSARWQDPKAVQLPEAIGFDDGVYESDEEEE